MTDVRLSSTYSSREAGSNMRLNCSHRKEMRSNARYRITEPNQERSNKSLQQTPWIECGTGTFVRKSRCCMLCSAAQLNSML